MLQSFPNLCVSLLSKAFPSGLTLYIVYDYNINSRARY